MLALLGVVSPAEGLSKAGDAKATPHSSHRAAPARGVFLVASRQLGDPSFAESVILLLDYDPQGAIGVVINQPTDVKVSSVLPDVEELRERKETLLIGGPVARDRILVLLRSAKPPKGATEVFGRVYMSGSLSVLRDMAGRKRADEQFQAYAGFAGWAPGQLDAEIERGDWYTSSAEAAVIFDEPATDVWPQLIRRVEGEWADSAEPPSRAALGPRLEARP